VLAWRHSFRVKKIESRMGDIINFPGRNRGRPERAVDARQVQNIIRSASPRTEKRGPQSSVPTTDRGPIQLHKTAYELAGEIGKAYSFWFLSRSIPKDDQIYYDAVKKFASCLENIEAEYGTSSLKKLDGICIDLSGQELRWEKPSAGRMILYAPLNASASDIQDFISRSLQARLTRHN